MGASLPSSTSRLHMACDSSLDKRQAKMHLEARGGGGGISDVEAQ